MFLTALCRVLIKNKLYDEDDEILLQSIKENITAFSLAFSKSMETNRESTLFGDSFFSIFAYPIICNKSMELISLLFLLFEDTEKEHLELFNKILDEKGTFRPISDNYAISLVLISKVLLKYNRIDDLKKYITNCTVWLCDRYQENGLAPIGYKPVEEYEQIISEHLSGFSHHERKTSFIAAIILDVCAYLNEPEFYAAIANDFRAVEIIPEYYHINNSETLFNYEKVVSQTDHDFNLELTDDYAVYLKYRKDNYDINLSSTKLYLLSFLLRDRYFPQKFFNKE